MTPRRRSPPVAANDNPAIDPRYALARRLLRTRREKPSVSWLQRQMQIGYNEAARWLDQWEAEGPFRWRP
jgi:DNA segregation ATPase FtsK/SpoIIIE-like protein